MPKQQAKENPCSPEGTASALPRTGVRERQREPMERWDDAEQTRDYTGM